MKAADRCREHFAGDRCTKARGHASDLAIDTDKEHVGKFTRWVGTGAAKKQLFATAPGPTRQQEKKLDRWLARLDPFAVPPQQRPGLKAFLDRIIAAPGGF